MWREEFGRSLLRVDIEPLPEVPFRPEAKLHALPGLRTIECTGSSARFTRTKAFAADGDDGISIIVSKRCIASQSGREVILGPGDAVAVLHEEPARVTFPGGSFLGVFVPRAALASRLRDVDDNSLRLIRHDTEALRLLVSYVRTVRDTLALMTPEIRRLVMSHIYDLVAMALRSPPATSERGVSAVAAAHLVAMTEYIAAHFQEPELSVAAVANHQGISPRYVQRLLETSGSSFTERVSELRLQRAFELLTNGHDSKRRISDIAFDAGFSDISHFNRLFRRRFGDTPSGVRALRK